MELLLPFAVAFSPINIDDLQFFGEIGLSKESQKGMGMGTLRT